MDIGAAFRAEIEAIVSRRLDDLAAQLRSELASTSGSERLLRKKDAATRAGVSVTTLDRWLADGSLPHVLVPGRVPGRFEKRVLAADLDAFIRGLAGNRRPTTNSTRRSTSGSKTKRTVKREPSSLADLVEQRRKQTARQGA